MSNPTRPSADSGLERLEKHLTDMAAKAGGQLLSVPMASIEPQWRVRMKCQVPLCEYYGVCKVCPPHIPGIDAFKAAVAGYSRAYLVIYREPIEDLSTYRHDFTAELKLARMVDALEREAFAKGFYSAMGLTVGGCKLCPECTPVNEPCRHPFKARPSPEGFGIDITTIAREAGVALEWPPKKTVTFLGLFLI